MACLQRAFHLIIKSRFTIAHAVLDVLGCRLNAWSFLTTVLGILAGIYGVNSAAGAWSRKGGLKTPPPDDSDS
ncbi:MAG: hypothetical protein JRI66_12635 [Deltaproteobacteria bacterium]|nr:hypothetical protein [Deltaproteobacteria bacterium]